MAGHKGAPAAWPARAYSAIQSSQAPCGALVASARAKCYPQLRPSCNRTRPPSHAHPWPLPTTCLVVGVPGLIAASVGVIHHPRAIDAQASWTEPQPFVQVACSTGTGGRVRLKQLLHQDAMLRLLRGAHATDDTRKALPAPSLPHAAPRPI